MTKQKPNAVAFNAGLLDLITQYGDHRALVASVHQESYRVIHALAGQRVFDGIAAALRSQSLPSAGLDAQLDVAFASAVAEGVRPTQADGYLDYGFNPGPTPRCTWRVDATGPFVCDAAPGDGPFCGLHQAELDAMHAAEDADPPAVDSPTVSPELDGGWGEARRLEIVAELNGEHGDNYNDDRSPFRDYIYKLVEFRQGSDHWDGGFVVGFELTDGTEIRRTRRPLGPWSVKS